MATVGSDHAPLQSPLGNKGNSPGATSRSLPAGCFPLWSGQQNNQQPVPSANLDLVQNSDLEEILSAIAAELEFQNRTMAASRAENVACNSSWVSGTLSSVGTGEAMQNFQAPAPSAHGFDIESTLHRQNISNILAEESVTDQSSLVSGWMADTAQLSNQSSEKKDFSVESLVSRSSLGTTERKSRSLLSAFPELAGCMQQQEDPELMAEFLLVQNLMAEELLAQRASQGTGPMRTQTGGRNLQTTLQDTDMWCELSAVTNRTLETASTSTETLERSYAMKKINCRFDHGAFSSMNSSLLHPAFDCTTSGQPGGFQQHSSQQQHCKPQQSSLHSKETRVSHQQLGAATGGGLKLGRRRSLSVDIPCLLSTEVGSTNKVISPAEHGTGSCSMTDWKLTNAAALEPAARPAQARKLQGGRGPSCKGDRKAGERRVKSVTSWSLKPKATGTSKVPAGTSGHCKKKCDRQNTETSLLHFLLVSFPGFPA